MKLCECNNITETDVRRSIGPNHPSVSDVYDFLGVRPKCGECRSAIRRILRKLGRSAMKKPLQLPAAALNMAT